MIIKHIFDGKRLYYKKNKKIKIESNIYKRFNYQQFSENYLFGNVHYNIKNINLFFNIKTLFLHNFVNFNKH